MCLSVDIYWFLDKSFKSPETAIKKLKKIENSLNRDNLPLKILFFFSSKASSIYLIMY